MNVKISHTATAQKFLEEASGLHNDEGSPRAKALIYRILRDSVNIIEDLAVTPEEFWKAVNYLNVLGARQEAGLLAAGLGLEHYLDLLMDAADEQAGKSGGTPRTIEGPLYVAGAPLSQGEARLDDGVDHGFVRAVVTLHMDVGLCIAGHDSGAVGIAQGDEQGVIRLGAAHRGADLVPDRVIGQQPVLGGK